MLKKLAQNFRSNTKGNFAAMFAILVPVLFGSAGLVVDYTRMNSAQAELSYIIDAAVLATTQDLTTGAIPEADARNAVVNFVRANLDDKAVAAFGVTIDSITIDRGEQTLQVTASATVPVTFMRVLGQEDKPVGVLSKASYSNTMIEVAIALDVTGSMAGSKIASLKRAATNAVDTLIPDADAADRVRIGLVPYASSVNVGPVLSRVPFAGASTGCVFERGDGRGGEITNDDAPRSGNPFGGTTSSSECVRNEITQMTNSVTRLKSDINALNASGFTAGHLGVAWTQYMLSPQWNGVWDFNSQVTSYGDTSTRKFAIIMTDGQFNTFLSNGQGNGRGVNQSRDAALGGCSSMKTNGVQVFTIAFQAPTEAAQLMDECATDDTATRRYYYNATSEADLIRAFEEIARDIENLRLVN